MTAAAADPNLTFAYQAQTFDGKSMVGTLDAPHLDAAMHQLSSIGLRVMEIEPVVKPAPKPRPLRGDDFLAFNEQLAHLALARQQQLPHRLTALDLLAPQPARPFAFARTRGSVSCGSTHRRR